MSTSTVTVPNIQVQLSVDQLIAAAKQLAPSERVRLAKSLVDTALDADLQNLICKLQSVPPVDNISDDEIQAEVLAVRQQRR